MSTEVESLIRRDIQELELLASQEGSAVITEESKDPEPVGSLRAPEEGGEDPFDSNIEGSSDLPQWLTEKQCTHWGVTLFYWANSVQMSAGDDPAALGRELLESELGRYVKSAVCQLELCPSTDHHHMHMAISFTRSLRAASRLKALWCKLRIQLPKAGKRGVENLYAYCSKEETRVRGPWVWNYDLSKIPKWGTFGGKKNKPKTSFEQRVEAQIDKQLVADAAALKIEQMHKTMPTSLKYDIYKICPELKQNVETQVAFAKMVPLRIPSKLESEASMNEAKQAVNRLFPWNKSRLLLKPLVTTNGEAGKETEPKSELLPLPGE